MPSWISDEVVMRFVDDELPWVWRIPVRAGVILSPGLRARVRMWRSLSTDVAALRHHGGGGRGIRARPRSSWPN
jgi:hypothetical protein